MTRHARVGGFTVTFEQSNFPESGQTELIIFCKILCYDLSLLQQNRFQCREGNSSFANYVCCNIERLTGDGSTISTHAAMSMPNLQH